MGGLFDDIEGFANGFSLQGDIEEAVGGGFGVGLDEIQADGVVALLLIAEGDGYVADSPYAGGSYPV